jgi:hypothetical protein
MFKSHLLPDHKLSLREREEERRASQEPRKSSMGSLFERFFDPEVRRQEEQTRALERNADAMERYTEELRRQRGDEE